MPYRVKHLINNHNRINNHDIKFKMNTVIRKENYLEDMNHHIEILDPFRWKVFQMLLVESENFGDGAPKNATSFTVNDE